MSAVRLAPNLVDHFYRGGAKIAALRGIETTSPRQPEEWIAATVTRSGDGRTGLARTHDGDLLRDLVAADPAGWLGGEAGTAAGPAPPTPACWSSCSTPVSGCPCTSTRTGTSRRGTWAARTARPRPGSSCTATATARSTSAGATTSTRRAGAGPGRAGQRVDAPAQPCRGARGRRRSSSRPDRPRDRRGRVPRRGAGADRLLDPARVVGDDVRPATSPTSVSASTPRCERCLRGLGGDDLARLVRHVGRGRALRSRDRACPARRTRSSGSTSSRRRRRAGRPGVRRGAGPARLRRARLAAGSAPAAPR